MKKTTFVTDLFNRIKLGSPKTWLYILGSVLFASSIIFIAIKTSENWREISNYDLVNLKWEWIGFSLLFYFAGQLSTSLIWPNILAALNQPIDFKKAVIIGLVSQIGKYLPGNIAHYVGRAAIAKFFSISLTKSAQSTFLEFLFAGVASVSVFFFIGLIDLSVLHTVSFLHALVPLSSNYSYRLLLSFGILISIGVTLLIVKKKTKLNLRRYALIYLLGIFSFSVVGISLFCVLHALEVQSTTSLLYVIGVFSFAWLAGFIVPGAPAGFGVREVILIAALTQVMPTSTAILISLIHRTLTIFVDIVVFAIAFINYRRFASRYE